MDQTLLCGVGNIYKSEVLFTCRVNPLVPIARLTDSQLTKIIQTARHLMRRNVGPGPRRTRYRNDAHRCWVYRRMGQACLECGTTIQMIRQGELGRSTYWCPTCQPTPLPSE